MNILVGQKLKELRKSNDFSFEDIYIGLKVSVSAYARMEKGSTATWTSKVDLICKLYKIEAAELLLTPEQWELLKWKRNQKKKKRKITVKCGCCSDLKSINERLLALEKDKNK